MEKIKTKPVTGPTTKLAHCNCEHPQQNQMYGPQQRVHNRGGKTKEMASWRCTVCGTKR